MLQTPGAVLVIDGYNMTKHAWPEATAADQRERLGIATTALHRRLGCRVVIVFDGDGSGVARPTLRRGGVRVLFSDASEEADEVVVRETAALPKRVPVIVASSDAWVREHARAEGAVVVGADALVRVVRPEHETPRPRDRLVGRWPLAAPGRPNVGVSPGCDAPGHDRPDHRLWGVRDGGHARV